PECEMCKKKSNSKDFRKQPAEIVPATFPPFLRGKSYRLHQLNAFALLYWASNAVWKLKEIVLLHGTIINNLTLGNEIDRLYSMRCVSTSDRYARVAKPVTVRLGSR